MHKHGEQPTKERNILDLVFNTEEGFVSYGGASGTLGANDHAILEFNVMHAYIKSQVMR